MSNALPQNCGTCNAGTMVQRKGYRRSTPVVVIGYLLNISAVIGIILGIFVVFASPNVKPGVPTELNERFRAELVAKEVPEPIIERVLSNEPVDAASMEQLTQTQRDVINAANAGYKVLGYTDKIVAGIGILFIIGSLALGLLGWFLVRRKTFLQCDRCSAVAASA